MLVSWSISMGLSHIWYISTPLHLSLSLLVFLQIKDRPMKHEILSQS